MNKELNVSLQSPNTHELQSDIPWHGLETAQVLESLKVSQASGLSKAEATQKLENFGPNEIAAKQGRSVLSLFIHQFKSVMVALLVVATLAAFALGEQIEGIAVLIVIVLNALIGFLTEWKAEQTLTALQRQSVPTAQVLREGSESQIPARELVPGDIVIVNAGGRVPADGRILESVQLQIEEAALTGESHTVSKTHSPLDDPDRPLGDRTNMAFMGTTVTEGRGRIVVTATGPTTEMGKIGVLVGEVANRDTPLEKKLARLGWVLVIIVLALCAVIVTAGWLRGNELLEMLEIGVSLAIAAVPEGLPAVATMTLAIGMQRMARMGALVRKLSAVETLGSTTIICTDKTGTLTKNEITVSNYLLEDRKIDVRGSGYAPKGEFQINNEVVQVKDSPHLLFALQIGALCNDASLQRDAEQVTVLGDPTEAALIVAAEKAGLDIQELKRQFERVHELPFDSTTKRMVTVHKCEDGSHVAFVKGSPAMVVASSTKQYRVSGPVPMNEADREHWLSQNQSLAKSGLRVLALAYQDAAPPWNDEALTENLVFVGLVGMIDPLREEAKPAIDICRQAGIRSVMITGDQQLTAAEIARQLGIDRDLQGQPLRTVHARELKDLSDQAWRDVVSQAAVFARVSPKHKLDIVQSLQAQGQIVAMTGDGVNDAPALKQADIGIAMGIKGTEVAKETSDMVITDDNFATIVTAVEQGRIIYANIIKFIHYLFSCNFAEILTVFVAIMVGWPLPLGPLQILWLNLITDIFPALALALEPSAPDMMNRPPRDPKEPLLPVRFMLLIAWQGLLLGGVTLFAFAVGMHWYGQSGEGLKHAATIAFMTLALAQVFHAFNARSQHRSALTRQLFTNGWLWLAVAFCTLLQIVAVYVPLFQELLDTTPPSLTDWGLILLCSLLPIAIVECIKLTLRIVSRLKRRPTQGTPESKAK